MANEDDKKEAPAADAAPKKERPKKEGQGGGKKKAAEPTGPAPKYKRENPPKLRKLYDSQIREQMKLLSDYL